VTIATVDTAASDLDTVQPWPGLDAFTEETSRFFCGRDTEADELFRHVRRDVVTVLFGRSGLGKTSLLQAGLFPRLRKAGFLPILIRLDYTSDAPSPVAQVRAAIERDCAAAKLSESTWNTAEESLWGCFHRADRRLRDRTGKEVVPVLVLDQFEEIFTQGLAGSASRAASQSFITELAELVENRPPKKLEQAIEADPEIVEGFRFDRLDYRIVLALREDFLAALEGLRTRSPSLGRNRYRLRGMTGAQGLDAIINPVPGLVDYDAAQEIIRLVGRANPDHTSGAIGAGEAAEGFQVEPSLLSLVCRELNDRRVAQGLEEISTDLLAGSRDKIIEEFYERCLTDQPASLRAFVEDELLSASGFRESVTLDTAQRALSDSGVPAGALDELVRRRLLHIEERSDVARVEIIHDVLTPVIRRSRETRRLHQAEAAAAEREAALHRQRQRLRLAYLLTTTMALLLVATVALAWWGWSSKVEAERQHAVAEEQRTLAEAQQALAEQQRAAANEQRVIAEQQSNLAEQQRASATAESERAKQNLEIAITTADSVVTTVTGRLRDFTGISAAAGREILLSAERAFYQIAQTSPDSQHLRWRRATMLISFADNYLSLGEKNEALRNAQTASDIMLSLAKENPAHDGWQADLADSFRAIGDALCMLPDPCIGGTEDLLGALTAYRNDLEIMEQLVSKHPENLDWQSKLAVAHAGIGQVLLAQGDPRSALPEFRAYLGIAQKLAEKSPDIAEWRHKIGGGHTRVGWIFYLQGDFATALAEGRTALDIARRLVETEPDNTRWQNDLSLAHVWVGTVLRAQGELAASLAEYRSALDAARHLVEKDPSNVGWARTFSFINSSIDQIASQLTKINGKVYASARTNRNRKK
jgi:tetratricopeptide (TPR) repeat protein